MCLFKKNKNKKKITVNLNGLDNAMDASHSSLTSYDQIEFKVLTQVDDETLTEIADIIKLDKPVEVDFSRVLNQPEESQKFVTFLSGVTYALDGRNEFVNSSIIFGSFKAFKDGSIDAYIARKKQ